MLVKFSQKYISLPIFSKHFYGTKFSKNKRTNKSREIINSNKNYRQSKDTRFQANIADSPKNFRKDNNREDKFIRINDKKERSTLNTILSNNRLI